MPFMEAARISFDRPSSSTPNRDVLVVKGIPRVVDHQYLDRSRTGFQLQSELIADRCENGRRSWRVHGIETA
jgi:hypothetical protein